MKLLREGDNGAWESFFQEFDKLIGSVVAWSKWHFQPHVRDDILQGIREELTRAVPKADQIASMEHFIKRVCIRRCIDEVRRQVRTKQTLVPLARKNDDGGWREADIEAGDGFDPIRAVIASERAVALRQLLEGIGPTCKAAIRQYYLQELSYKEIAAETGIAINTVGSRLAKCLVKLRAMVEKDAMLREDS